MKNVSAIEELYYEKSQDFGLTEECKRLLNEVIKNDDTLISKLSSYPDLLALYKKTNESIENLHCESVKNNYIMGFKLGLLIGIETMDGEI